MLAEATSDALLIADRLLSAAGDHTLPPTLAPVKVPTIVVPANGKKTLTYKARVQL